MTECERQFYLLLCMSGRTKEATEYRERIESREVSVDAGEKDTKIQDNGCSQKVSKRGKTPRG